MRSFQKTVIVLVLILLVTASFNLSLAKTSEKKENSLLSLWNTIRSKFIDTLVTVGVLVSVIVIIVGALCLVLSLGGIEVIATTQLLYLGKDLIRAGFNGLLILLTFYFLMGVINPGWTNFTIISSKKGKILFFTKSTPEEEIQIPEEEIKIPKENLTFQEIPLGITVENVLAKAIDCFYLNPKGEIDDAHGDTPEFDPFLDHDRYDCAIRVAKAIETKQKELIRLTKIYQEILKECNCQYCQCQCAGRPCHNCIATIELKSESSEKTANCYCFGPPPPLPQAFFEYLALCKFLKPYECSCPRSTDPDHPSSSALCYGYPCSPETTQKLNEFWEKYLKCAEAQKEKMPGEEEENEAAEERDLIKTVENDYFDCLKKHSVQDCSSLGWIAYYKFQSLSICQQIQYLNGKLNQFLEEIKSDVAALETAASLVESDYLVEPYIEFIKIAEEYEKKYEGEVIINKFQGYDHSKYCKGYSHLSLQDKCPGDSWLSGVLGSIIGLFSEEKQEEYWFDLHTKSCGGACTAFCRKEATVSDSSGNTYLDSKKFFTCMHDTEPCLCAFYSKGFEEGTDPSQFLTECKNCEDKCYEKSKAVLDGCSLWKKTCDDFCIYWEKKCKEECDYYLKKPLTCYKECEKEFNLKGPLGGYKDQCHQTCKNEYNVCRTNVYNTYLMPCLYNCYGVGCKYCTDQYSSAFEECFKNPDMVESFFKTGEFFDWTKRHSLLKTPLCYKSSKVLIPGAGGFYPGIESYPETAKCSSCSSCPECQCTTCSGTCAEFGYDGDPLTFYSRTNPPPEESYPGPLGEKMTCDRKKEIPLGRLVDKTLIFPEKIIKYLEIIQKATKVSLKIIKSINPSNFACEGRKGYLKHLLNQLEGLDPTKVTKEDLENLLRITESVGFQKENAQKSNSVSFTAPSNYQVLGISASTITVKTLDPVVGSKSALLRGKIIEDNISDEPTSQFYDFRWSGPQGNFSTPCLGPITPSTSCSKCQEEYKTCYSSCSTSECKESCSKTKEECEKKCKEITFSYSLGNLSPSTTYKFSACICNVEKGPIQCGETLSFITQAEFIEPTSPPEVKTLEPGIGSSSANLRGEVTDSGGATCQRYFYWGESPNSLTNKKDSTSGGTGIFSGLITGLVSKKTYYFKACAQNTKGESCGNVLSFTTEEIKPPEITAPRVETLLPLSVPTPNSVSLRGNIVDSGGETCDRYFYWSKDKKSLTNYLTAGRGQTGIFTATLSSLNPETTYYYKACAKNSKGEGCGEILSFTTSSLKPPEKPPEEGPLEVNTLDAQPGTISAVLKGEIVKSGGETCQRWFEFGGKTINVGIGGVGVFQAGVSCLVGGKSYSYKACAKNSKETKCGALKSFTTKEAKPSPPSASAEQPLNIKGNSATLMARVNDWGGSNGSCRFFYGKKQDPCEYYTLSSWQSYEGQCDTVEYPITNLEPNTLYRYTVQCQNKTGQGSWSNWVEFKTCGPPEGKLLEPEISPLKVVFKGVVTEGGCEEAEAQFVWRYKIKGEEQTFVEDTLKEKFKTNDIFEQAITVDGYGLPEGEYYLKAVLKNSAGETELNEIKFTVDYEKANPIPDPPSYFYAFAKNTHAIELVWENGYKATETIIVMKKGKTPPKSIDDGEVIYPFSEITPLKDNKYKIQKVETKTFKTLPDFLSKSSPTAVIPTQKEGGGHSLLIDGLDPDTYYSFAAFSINENFEGLASTQHAIVSLQKGIFTVQTKEPILRCETGCSCCLVLGRIPIYWKGKYYMSIPAVACGCRNLPCQGDPTNIEKEIRGLEKILEIIKYNVKEFEEGFPAQERSELLKQLIYSRKMINECSEVYVEQRRGPEKLFPPETAELRERTKLLSCTRAVDEILVSPNTLTNGSEFTEGSEIRKCYGADPDAFEKIHETDDWYCCSEVRK